MRSFIHLRNFLRWAYVALRVIGALALAIGAILRFVEYVNDRGWSGIATEIAVFTHSVSPQLTCIVMLALLYMIREASPQAS